MRRPFDDPQRAAGWSEAAPRMPCAPIAQRVAALLEAARLDLSTEYRTQGDIAEMLATEFGPAFVREHRLGPRDRVDFWHPGEGLALEVKRFRRTSAKAVLAQLTRYAGHADVRELMLATGHSVSLPGMIDGKRLWVVNIGRGWL